jgi:multidrug transporter EmrE-like cation transporter
MSTLILASATFSVGGAFMKPSGGLTRLWPSVVVVLSFLAGSLLLTLAVHHGALSTTYVLGLGLEALVSVGVGVVLLGERLTAPKIGGIVVIAIGLVMVNSA